MEDESDPGEQCVDGRDDETPGFCREVLERDRIYEALAHERRRYLCYLLADRSELQVDEAVAAIADWESEESGPGVDRQGIRLSLLHSHIPKLRATDVIDFDPHSGTLVPDDADGVLTALQAVGRALCADHATDGDGEAA